MESAGHMKYGTMEAGNASLRISRLLLAPSSTTHTRSTSSVPSAATAAAKPAVPPPTPK
jgi:hypothetical protein